MVAPALRDFFLFFDLAPGLRQGCFPYTDRMQMIICLQAHAQRRSCPGTAFLMHSWHLDAWFVPIMCFCLDTAFRVKPLLEVQRNPTLSNYVFTTYSHCIPCQSPLGVQRSLWAIRATIDDETVFNSKATIDRVTVPHKPT